MPSLSQFEFDIIFAGGGTAACLIAGRLALADPSLKILILEAGPPTLDDPAHTQPARYLNHLRPDSTTVKHHTSQPNQHLGGRSVVISCGQCLGGGSSVNFLMYTRASASDYDDWESKNDNPGWGSKDMIPLLKKVETYQVQADQDTHGYSGFLKVSVNKTPGNVAQDFFGVCSKYDSTRGTTNDMNGMFSCDGYAQWPRWIDSQNGRRSDVPHSFIYPLRDNTNLVVKTGCLVKRVVFQDGRAVGVQFVRNKNMDPDVSTDITTVRASRLVVVSAGALGSPAILERSGIGARDLLEKLGINAIVDLPGVGESYQDHNLLSPTYLSSEESSTLDKIIANDTAEIEKWLTQWVKDGTGMMASNGVEAGIKLRPNEKELGDIGPAFTARWKEFFVPAPDKPVLLMGTIAFGLGELATLSKKKLFSVAFLLGYPSALGTVHITSGDNVYAPPDIAPDFLKSDGDLALLVWAYKRSREIARRMKCYRGEFLPYHPAFPEGSAATCHESANPVALETPDIEYTAEDDEAIKVFARATVISTWHSLGTCSMKPRDKGGVVDSNLNVYGVQGLKVADMSIAPGNVGSNTYSTALAIGEKAALIIASELGISGV